MDNVVSVEDVSTQNIGYDLRAAFSDGRQRYYEVKSVSSLGETFSLTNNEYSTATQYGENYYMAICQQDDQYLRICFVSNPIEALDLTKRVVRWEWICNEYSGELVSVELG